MRAGAFAESEEHQEEAHVPEEVGSLTLVVYADGTARVVTTGLFDGDPKLIHTVLDSLN